MNAEQQELFDQLTPLQKRMATNVLAGLNQRQAYYASEGSAKSDTAADTSASEIMNNPKVKSFMDSMRKQALNDAIMSREEMLTRLSLFARKGVSDITKFKTVIVGKDPETGDDVEQTVWTINDSSLQNEEDLSIISELEVGKNGPKIKTHSSLQAMAQIAKIQGYEAASKHEIGGLGGGPILTKDVTELSDEALLALIAGSTAKDE